MATYDLAYPGAAIDAILNTAYFLQEAGYIFQGSASEYSGTPSKRVWLIAPAGSTGFGLSSAVPQGSIGICLYNGTAWVGKVINVLTLDSQPTRNSQNGVTSGGVAATLDEIAGGIMETFASLLFDDETAAGDLSTKLSYAVKFAVSNVYQTVTHLNILAATTSKAGLMSAEDKAKVDSFLTNLRSLTFADTTASADQGTQITETLKATIGGVQEVIDSITLLAATSSKAGLLSASDKAYIDALPATLTSLSNSISGALALMQSLVGYYVCDTAAGTAAKTVAATGYSLTNGGCIRIKMTNANTAANVTLNINSTGAKALYYDGAQASATNTWEAGEVLEVYYDGTQYQCASGGGGKFATGEKVKDTSITDTITENGTSLPTEGAVHSAIQAEVAGNLSSAKYEQIPVTWIAGKLVDVNNALVNNASYSAVQNVDVSAYKRIIACVEALSGAKVVILDTNQTILATKNGSLLNIDLTAYPTAKYMSFSNNGTKYSGVIYGFKQEQTSLQDAFADYVEFGDNKENYVRNIGQEIYVAPRVITGYCIGTSNNITTNGSNNRYTDYGAIPIGATKIYYSGRSYGSAAGVVWYDKYKNMISYSSGVANADVTDMEFTIPSNAVYYRCSSLNSLLAYHFDVMPSVVLGGNANNVTVYNQIAAEWTYNGYINSSDTVATQGKCYYIKDMDISAYAGKRIVVMNNASLPAMKNLLMDANYNVLFSSGGSFDIDLANFPTAKYLSLTNNLSTGSTKYSGNVYLIEESAETLSEIVGNYYEVYGNSSPAYAKMITDMFYVEPKADVTGYYINNNEIPVSSANARYTSQYYLIPAKATKIYYTGVSYGSAMGVMFYDKYKNRISAVAVGDNPTPVVNAEVAIPAGAVYYRLSSMSAACSATFDNPTIPVGGSDGGSDLSNYLYGKKYVAIGDSFTAAIGTEVIEEGPLSGLSKVYPYIIANRNNMTVLNQGSSGTVLNGYIIQNKYNDIPEDVDYITIWYGINDSGHGISVGTIDDQPEREDFTSESAVTTCGGFNWIFKWLCTNRPYAKVGCIITDYSTEERRNAIIDCCKKWGIAYLDLMGDPTIPMFPAGRNSTIPVSADAVALKQQYFDIAAGNFHPSNKCHEWQSTILEAFMRRI